MKLDRLEIRTLSHILKCPNSESSYQPSLGGILKWGLLLKDLRVHLIGQSNLGQTRTKSFSSNCTFDDLSTKLLMPCHECKRMKA